jgi:hypothetical protein
MARSAIPKRRHRISASLSGSREFHRGAPRSCAASARLVHRRSRLPVRGSRRIPDFQVPTHAALVPPTPSERGRMASGDAGGLETWEPGDLPRAPTHAHSGRSTGTSDPSETVTSACFWASGSSPIFDVRQPTQFGSFIRCSRSRKRGSLRTRSKSGYQR